MIILSILFWSMLFAQPPPPPHHNALTFSLNFRDLPGLCQSLYLPTFSYPYNTPMGLVSGPSHSRWNSRPLKSVVLAQPDSSLLLKVLSKEGFQRLLGCPIGLYSTHPLFQTISVFSIWGAIINNSVRNMLSYQYLYYYSHSISS